MISLALIFHGLLSQTFSFPGPGQSGSGGSVSGGGGNSFTCVTYAYVATGLSAPESPALTLESRGRRYVADWICSFGNRRTHDFLAHVAGQRVRHGSSSVSPFWNNASYGHTSGT